MVEDFNTICDMVKQFEKPNHIFIVRVIDKLVDKKSVHRYFYVKNHEELNNLKSTIDTLCKLYNAQAFIDLNSRHINQVMTKTLKNLAEHVYIMNSPSIKDVIDYSTTATTSYDNNQIIVYHPN